VAQIAFKPICFVLIVLLIGCESEPKEEKPLVFFVLGDWGRRGSPNQKVVAFQLNEWVKKEQPKFILATGDNFYNNGVTDVEDSHWTQSFENVYSEKPLSTIPWYVALGNHDYGGNVQAQIDYTELSSRWNMPERYFSIVENIPKGKARFIFIDSSPFENSYYSNAVYAEKLFVSDSAKQKKWLDSLTILDDVAWEIVIGHHHIYTGGVRKNEANSVRDRLEPLFEKNAIDLYLCGHEHDLQHLKHPDKPTNYFLSGTGSEIRPTGTIAESLFSASVLGFMCFTLTDKHLEVKVIDYNGNVVYSTSIDK
jgi:DNA repair exonuclease SbcCD nuclease subunit